MKALGAVVLGIVVVSTTVLSQSQSVLMEPRERGDMYLTGHVRIDLFGQTALWDHPIVADRQEGTAMSQEKSPWLGAGLSLLIPGSGQFYAESYWKAALFLAIEVVAVTAAVVNNNKGDEQTARYEEFAHQHWSVVQYARWTEENFSLQGQFQWDQGGGNVHWDELNRMERAVGGYYSHTLPPFGSQQYYELIGKYPQYNQGWDDAPPTFSYGDPLTPRFLSYSADRGNANSYYDRASTFVTIVVVNHILSALDAAWSTSMYNSDIRARASMQRIPAGDRMEEVPALQLSYNF